LATTVRFLVLTSNAKQKLICELAEKFYLAGKKTIILVNDDETGNELDRLLWIWKQSSFVPHLFTHSISYKILEPVVITSQVIENPGFDLLILANPAAAETIMKFEQVIDFAEKFDEHLLKLSRDRFISYRENKLNLETWESDKFLAASLP
jgi:DNA polymerase III subunit chi